MSTLEKPGIAWADQQPVRQPVRRCGFRELRPPPGRAELEATIADLEGQIAGSTKPKPVEAGGVPASLRPRGEGRSPSSKAIAFHAYYLWLAGPARRHRLGRLARRRAATRGLGLRGLAARSSAPRESRRQRHLPARVGTLSVRVSSFTTVMSRTVPPLRTAWTRSTTWRIWERSPSTFVPEAWVSMIRPDSLSSSWRAGPRAARRRRRRSGSPGFRL